MKGYKLFNPNWACRGFQYKVGKSYEMECRSIICEQGFHFCTELKDCFNYYDFNPKNRIAEVNAYGDIDKHNDDSKHCTNKIQIVREISWEEALKILGYKEIPDGSFDVQEVTLLSIEEYKKYKENIVDICKWWWLRSPGSNSNYAASVYNDFLLNLNGLYVNNNFFCVRPALIVNLKSSNLQIGRKIIFKGNPWTVISDDLMICDKSVGNTYFRKDWKALDANVYEKSDIKIWLENWAKNNGIITM